jgi:CRISPR-associated protein Csm5
MDKFRNSISGYRANSKEEFSTQSLRIRQQRGDRPVWDAKFDFMKFLFVSDLSAKEVNPFVAKVENKNTSKPGDYHEIVPEKTEFHGEVQIANGNQFHTFVEKYRVDGLRKSLFTGLAEILEACYDMTNGILDEEIAFFSKSKTYSAQKQLEDIRKQNTKNSPVIRIGKHQGFMSLTLATLVKKLGEGVFREYAESLSYRNKRIYPNNFPKTRKVLINSAKEELTLGWVKIEVE